MKELIQRATKINEELVAKLKRIKRARRAEPTGCRWKVFYC